MTYATAQYIVDMPATSAVAQCAARRIGIVLGEGFPLMTVGMIAEAFQLANQSGARGGDARATYSVQLLSVDGGRLASSSSLHVYTDARADCRVDAFDALFVFGAHSFFDQAARDERLRSWLHDAPLSRDASALRERAATQPASCVIPQNVGGRRTTMVFDVPQGQPDDRDESMRSVLALISRDAGAAVAREVAERLMPGAAARWMATAGAGELSVADKIRRSALWLREHCDRPISVTDAAQEAAMSERNFLRRFKLEIGCTPSEYLLQARLDMTRRLLAGTELPVDKIARRSGMGNGDNLAKMFRKRWSISPTEYRLYHRRERHFAAAHASSPQVAKTAVADLAA
ncbi:helix-turn-helix domain-containing protein [Paraburkholderia caballeronis]|uniref:Transcriptional regulator GlxA family, contains an amidase domain and an AraC-type DNA-binding HTH domain n=1 Tax=Paraburkholderia caballeronis TaxID=416943 RepID=A0A1H7JXZ6_9BURK|nr:helix-turn-helix domain-containing protein [Paraburkholderia caballeronis]PXW27228.1 AraC family transcriptional regulator [Paraburkholderia caballeronis]PXX02702.1 AraC family transcriptional regulator [Paraburkholderia caballeronis]RAK03427.1 AraC family transcriptional regulator [Paraburkholderia caballeronis]SEC41546.1 transcriptional regulator, AraC family [Paraburkholderia caballeronis]SEK79166.1 Transcriptional regulator GlxA family, contains an amidase domain and an AraC-type DNA-bi